MPIGFTSARAPGTADFSMSTGAGATDENGSRRSRRGTGGRERDLEEVSLAVPLADLLLFDVRMVAHAVSS